jgi:PAP2 superfamily protein
MNHDVPHPMIATRSPGAGKAAATVGNSSRTRRQAFGWERISRVVHDISDDPCLVRAWAAPYVVAPFRRPLWHRERVPNVQLDWQQSALLAVALVAAALALDRRPRGRTLAPFAREAGVIAALYSVWMLAATLAQTHTAGAFTRGRSIYRIEQRWHLPSEQVLQNALLRHPELARTANLYYATMHFTALFAFLLWVFVRHRDWYRTVRTTVVGFTLLSLLIQFIPVAPPRLYPDLGFVDVAQRFGQSVYSFGLGADELSAMPSVHVGWAVLIGVAVVWISRSPWRWIFLLHPVLTVLVVTATANHWWADGIVAAALVVLMAAAQWLYSRRPQRVAATALEAVPADLVGADLAA